MRPATKRLEQVSLPASPLMRPLSQRAARFRSEQGSALRLAGLALLALAVMAAAVAGASLASNVFGAAALALVATSEQALRHERSLARLDPLTGLPNRRGFLEQAAVHLERLRRRGLPVTLVFLDCDHFKDVNDTRGHAAGDRLLREVAHAMAASIRATDVAARLGGDEFVLLLPGTAPLAARAAVASLRHRLAAAMAAEGWPVTFSLGVATWTTAPEAIDGPLDLADLLLYEAKRAGRDAARFAEVADRRPGRVG